MPSLLAATGLDPGIARVILSAFVLTFLAARITVLLIMLRAIPTLYLHVKGTHVHHLNYGIILLSLVGGYALLVQPTGWALAVAAGVYGVAMGLTYDEFGMWIHLGGPYWQRASFDAVTVVASLLGLVAFAPDLERFRPHHWATAGLLAAAAGVFAVLLLRSLRFARQRISPVLQQIEAHGPAE